MWYYKNKKDYEHFLRNTAKIIETLLDNENISYVKVQCRLKELDGFLKKVEQLKHPNPHRINDLAGIRIICYRLSQIEPIVGIIKKNFRILKIDDKSGNLGIDKMGYQALHIDAAYNKKRIFLPEYKQFKSFVFEIQICTSLRHTWNEIEHKRKYKIGIKLPKGLARIINEMSVMIDNVDRQLDKYSNDVDKLLKSNLKDEQFKKPIFSSDLSRFLNQRFRGSPGFESSFGEGGGEDVIEELNSIGIKTISDLIPRNIKQVYKKISRADDHLTYSLIVREIMIFYNAKDYFNKAWKKSRVNTLDNHCYRTLREFNMNVNLPNGLEWED